MASLIGAMRSSLGDSFWFLKLAVTVYMVYFVCFQAPLYIHDVRIIYLLYAFIAIIMQGSAIVAMHRNLNNKYPLFPGIFSIFEIMFRGVAAFLIVLIYDIIFIFLAYLLLLIPENPYIIYIKIICGLIITVVAIPFSVIPLVLFSARGKFFDAFRFNLVYNSAGNFIAQFIIYLIQALLIFGISFVCLYFFLSQAFGKMNIGIILLMITYFIINYYILMIYFSDLYDDVIPKIEETKKKGF